jgi:acetyl esterase
MTRRQTVLNRVPREVPSSSFGLSAYGTEIPEANMKSGKMRSWTRMPSHATWSICTAQVWSQAKPVTSASWMNSSESPMIHSMSKPRRASSERRRGAVARESAMTPQRLARRSRNASLVLGSESWRLSEIKLNDSVSICVFRFHSMKTVVRLFILICCFASLQAQERRTILAMGDSITEGGTQKCYRPHLARMIREAGVDAEFTGPKADKADGSRHAGYSGKSAEQVLAEYERFHREHPADIVLIHAGHNHFAEEKPVPGILKAMEEMIRLAREANPRVAVLVAQVIPSGKLPKYGYIGDLNREIPKLAKRLHRSQQPVIAVDQARGFDWKSDAVSDQVHPNDAGAAKMAAKWFEALKPLLGKAGSAGFPLPPDEHAALAMATRKIVYKKTADKEQELYLFQPEGLKPGEKRPAILYIHGGGWMNGEPAVHAMECVHFAKQGLVTATIRYRLLGKGASSPEDCLADAKSAMRYLRSHAAELQIDPEKIAAAGGSAGGHLAAALAMIEGFDDGQDDRKVSCEPDLLILHYPTIDLLDGWKGGADLCRKAGIDPKKFSPAQESVGSMPPTIILAGSEDPVSTVATNERFAKRMKQGKRVVALFTFEGKAHELFKRRPEDAHYQAVLILETRFLQEQGWLGRSPLPERPGVKFEGF